MSAYTHTNYIIYYLTLFCKQIKVKIQSFFNVFACQCNYFAPSGVKLFTMKGLTKKVITILGGGAVGFINGFFGGGGGMLCVPLLSGPLGEPTKNAHGTAMLIILPISIASAITYVSGGVFDFNLCLKVGIGAIIGGIIGATLLKKINSTAISIVFALLMAAAGARMAFF